METPELKVVSIYSKGYKKQLLISSSEVITLTSFLKGVIKNEVLVINTNLGVDIYYFAMVDHTNLIVDTFLLLKTSNGQNREEFIIKSLNHQQAIASETQRFFAKLVKNPLLFKSYSKSLAHQIKNYYKPSSTLINELLSLWKMELIKAPHNSSIDSTLLPLIMSLTASNIEEDSQPVVEALIREAMSMRNSN
ncbi:hypothetical protein [Mangrovimonas sp. DI 80]|uniref:hypothetical protein n=1 Tax=Mangrovimonas sp. DI 80 TaxID=1779330 RepID=UPI0009767A66|nr:hypothetical protein [Mangrovimonas sp. DI 80]OMP30356.1 hypothetical protein BKM32_13320 [Mangrovimonas sp. DI 80]